MITAIFLFFIRVSICNDNINKLGQNKSILKLPIKENIKKKILRKIISFDFFNLVIS